ncbi:MAG: hypothetical protein GY863_13500 [bacterium]|nr:hypothetical protein [bacterium]
MPCFLFSQVINDEASSRISEINDPTSQSTNQAGEQRTVGLPGFIVEGGFGLFNSFISDFETNFIRRPIIRAGISFETVNNLYAYYQVSRYPTEKRTPVMGIVDNSPSMISEDFVQLIQNIGVRIMSKSFLSMRNSITWIGTGLSVLKTENTLIEVWTTKSYENGKFDFSDQKTEEVFPVKKTGFFIEAGHLLYDSNIHKFGLTWGFSFIVKFDYGKTSTKDIGGLSFMLGTHLLKF